MKIILMILLALGLISSAHAQSSITIGSGAEINVGAGADICAGGEFGNISGSLTGSGSQCAGPLPVLLSSFTCNVVNGRDAKLSWTTMMEINNNGFQIERKQNDDSWINAGWINGNGNSTVPITYLFSDKKLGAGKYSYRLKQIDYNGNFEYHPLSDDVLISAPDEFTVSQSYPNPSNPTSKIDFQIPFEGRVTIKAYDVTGREVAVLFDDFKESGFYNATFDGTNLASGVYFYRILAEGSGKKLIAVKKLLLIK